MKIHLNDFLATLKFVAAPVLIAVGVPPVLVHDVEAGISLAERAANAGKYTSADKKALAIDATRVAAQTLNDAKPGSVNVAEALQAADNGIDAVVGTIKLVHGQK